MLHGRVRFLKWFGLTGAATLLLTACPEDAVDIVEPTATALDFAVAPLGAVVFPAGALSIDGLVLAQFDPGRDPDAFARATSPLGLGHSGTRYLIDPAGLNSSQDPRLPALGGLGTETVDVASACRFGDGGFWGGTDGWDFFCFLQNLRPNQDYTVMLVRYALTVNGQLDTEEKLLTGTITNPDQLTPLGGTPGGYPTEACDFSTARPTYTIGVTGTQNPLVMGFVTSDGSGNAVFDCLVGSGGFWKAGAGGLVTPDSAPFAPNTIGTFNLPRYNYVVVLEGTGTIVDPVPTGAQVLRFQVGVDIDASGAPINNGLAPLPAAAADTADLIAAPGGAGRPDSVTVDLRNLESLSGGAVWQAWLVNRDESPITFAPATATYQRVAIVRELDPVTGEVLSEQDSVLETLPTVSGFSGQLQADVGGTPQEIKHRLTITDVSTGGGSGVPGFFTDLVLTQESGAGATAPSISSALWLQYTDQGGTPSDFFDDVSGGGSLAFGHIDVSDPTSTRTFSAGEFAQSSGLGGVLDVGGEFREISIDLRNLPLPPQGYYYEGWLLNSATGAAISMGPITTLPPDTASLFDADVDQSMPGVTSTGIRFANARLGFSDPNAIISGTGADAAAVLTNFFLTLEPKLGGVSKNIADLETGSLPIEALIARRP